MGEPGSLSSTAASSIGVVSICAAASPSFVPDGGISDTDARVGASTLLTWERGLFPFAESGVGMGLAVLGPGEEGDTTFTVRESDPLDPFSFFLRWDRLEGVLGDAASEGDGGDVREDTAANLASRSFAFVGDMGVGLESRRESREGLGLSSAGDETGDEDGISAMPPIEPRPLPRPLPPREDPPLDPLEILDCL